MGCRPLRQPAWPNISVAATSETRLIRREVIRIVSNQDRPLRACGSRPIRGRRRDCLDSQSRGLCGSCNFIRPSPPTRSTGSAKAAVSANLGKQSGQGLTILAE